LQPIYANQPGMHAVALVTNDGWDEATLTWNTKPASALPLATWLPQASVPVLVSVADALQQDLPANGLLSLRLYATNSTADGRVDYAAKEAGATTAPQLSLLYTNAQALSTTQSFWVNVTAPQSPVLSEMLYVGGAFRLTVTGDGGPDYTVQTSTNLQHWEALFMTNGPAGPFVFGVTNQTVTPHKFYRILLGP